MFNVRASLPGLFKFNCKLVEINAHCFFFLFIQHKHISTTFLHVITRNQSVQKFSKRYISNPISTNFINFNSAYIIAANFISKLRQRPSFPSLSFQKKETKEKRNEFVKQISSCNNIPSRTLPIDSPC